MPGADAARIQDDAAVRTAIVDGFTTYGVPGLGQMNANLVRAAGFELANEHRLSGELFQYIDVCHGVFAPGFRTAPSPAVAAIANEPTRKRLRTSNPVDDGNVAPNDRVCFELPAEFAFGLDGARKDDESAGLLVQSLHDA